MVKNIFNWINGKEAESLNKKSFSKINPHDSSKIFNVPCSEDNDVKIAVESAKHAQINWNKIPPVRRGIILHEIVMEMIKNKNDLAKIVHIETGKSMNDAIGETNAAIECGLFYASEGQRLYAKTTTSGVPNKFASTIRQPVGIAGLIIAANTPIANISWKVFPALICGNAAILKASEDAPGTAWFFGKIAHQINDLTPGILNIVQGFGEDAGSALVKNKDVNLISFTGSTEVGRRIQLIADERLAKVSLELGGKNPLVVCDDADIENAIKWTLLSAFSNAGQRCASASRIIIFESIYNNFVKLLIDEASKLTMGNSDSNDFGPVINEQQLNDMLSSINKAELDGAKILIGGHKLIGNKHKNGFYIEPTLIENVDRKSEISSKELFGPIACLYKVDNYEEAIDMANDSPYGLTGSIHTKDFDRANHFIQNLEAGVAVVNAGTFGSEPHMPFGGVKQSGNGSREPGTEALDIYSNLKDIYINLSDNVN